MVAREAWTSHCFPVFQQPVKWAHTDLTDQMWTYAWKSFVKLKKKLLSVSAIWIAQNVKCWLALIAKSFLLSKWCIYMFLVKPFVVNLLVFDLIRLQMFQNAIFLCTETHSLGFVKVMGCAQFFPNVFNSQGQWKERSVFCLTRRNWRKFQLFVFTVERKKKKGRGGRIPELNFLN